MVQKTNKNVLDTLTYSGLTYYQFIYYLLTTYTLRNRHIILIVVVLALVLLLVCAATFCCSYWRTIPPQTIEYSIDPSIRGIERELLANATKRATVIWSELNPGLNFVIADKSDVLQITISEPWYTLTVTGFAECPLWDTDTTSCIIYVRPYLIQENTVDWSPNHRINVLAHEMGHVLGLAHHPDSSEDHLMGTVEWNPTPTSTDTKGYVVPAPLPLP